MFAFSCYDIDDGMSVKTMDMLYLGKEATSPGNVVPVNYMTVVIKS